MKPSLSTRLASLCAAIVISAIVLESVAELGHPASGADTNMGHAVASVAPAASTATTPRPL